MIEFINVDKWYGNFHVLKSINLKVDDGEVLVICGPSGSGKSTLIRCVNKLETINSGQILIDDTDVHGSNTRQSRISTDVGMVFQQFNLYPHMTVLSNVTLAPRKVRGLSADEANDIARSLLRKVGILDLESKHPGQLSGGQQQRVAIARALAMQPRIMLFDEPTSALDPEMVNEVLDVMTTLAAEGMTMLVVTHQMGFARKVADSVLFIDEGEIIEQQAPDTFFDNPQHERTRRFLSKILTH